MIAALKEFFIKIFSIIVPVKNRIYLESKPPFSDNTYSVYNEMINQKINQKYELFWIYDAFDIYNKSKIPENLPPNVHTILLLKKNIFQKFIKTIHMLSGKAYISCNTFYYGLRDIQYNLYLNHGAPFKKYDGYGFFTEKCDQEIALSTQLLDLTAIDSKIEVEKLIPFGFPRNDYFYFTDKVQVKSKCKLSEFDKIIIWMPTIRKRWQSVTSETYVYYPYGIPLIENNSTLVKINECLKSLNYYLIIKIHFAQDQSQVIREKHSNIGFYDNNTLEKHDVQLNELLSACDALLTDYSSVYFDYLLAEKPIGLIIYDLKEYAKSPGLQFNDYFDAIKGTYIYSVDQLLDFFKNDVQHNKNEKIIEAKNRYHEFFDGKSSERVVRHIMSEIEKRFRS